MGFTLHFILPKPPGGKYHLISQDWGTNQIARKALFTCVAFIILDCITPKFHYLLLKQSCLFIILQACSIWLPLTPVSNDACIKYVKGSHEWGQWFYPRKFETKNKYENEGTTCNGHREYFEAPDIDGEQDKYELLSWDLQVRSYVYKWIRAMGHHQKIMIADVSSISYHQSKQPSISMHIPMCSLKIHTGVSTECWWG